VIAVDPAGLVRTLYRRSSRHNFLFITDQCNSYCLMCSQPPKTIDDSYRLAELHRLIDLIDPATETLGFTGGEPTLFGREFVRLVEHCRDVLPNTTLHVLTNGRLFAGRELVQQLAQVAHPRLTLAIPLYSDVDSEHDYVVQAKGAFGETIHGLLNLAEHGIEVEIRVVVHRQTYARLPQLAAFIARNLPFALHVAIMGLELTGFTRLNLDALWIDPLAYTDQLRAAIRTIDMAGLDVSIYNLPLCVLPRDLWPFARRSISDWKNVYAGPCGGCSVREACGGFFASAPLRMSRGIAAL
jgi:His-Xaa-Ser system radical SAM maturase HxsC